jgi:uncharacterized integral membrane protein
LIASALLFGLLLGVALAVFAYSNTTAVNVGWSIFHANGIPLWTVVVVPLALVLVAGTVYHWTNSLHHFTEHMRHRRRVHELEAEVTALRGHLDQLLEMPDHSTSKVETPVAAAPALPEPVASDGGDKATKKSRKRVSLEPETVSSDTSLSPSAAASELPMNGEGATETEPFAESSAEK